MHCTWKLVWPAPSEHKFKFTTTSLGFYTTHSFLYNRPYSLSLSLYPTKITRLVSYKEMIRAGQVGRRATWNLGEFAKLCDVPDDTELDDKGQTVISYIDVSFGRVIRSIQFSYRENEALVLSEKYGSSDDHYTNLSNESVVVSSFFGNLLTRLVILYMLIGLMKLNRR